MTRKTKELSAILAVSFISTVLLFYVDESRYSFDFFSRPTEWGMLLLFTVVFSLVPLAIYGFVGDKNYYKSFKWALIGYLPPLIILCWLLSA